MACIARALRSGRRFLTRRQAAGLWNELGLGRAAAGELAGPNAPSSMPCASTPAATAPARPRSPCSNLAEIRHPPRPARRRAGEPGAVGSGEPARGNLRGAVEDAGIWARSSWRWAVRRRPWRSAGKPGRSWSARGPLARGGAGPAGRPRPGLARPAEEAAAELSGLSAAALAELEPEERPALHAHAGDGEGARREAAGTPFEPLWESLLAGGPPPARHWEALEALEPYRAARLVFDADLLVPGSAPAPWRREAIDTFRRMALSRPPSAWRPGTAAPGRSSP